MTNLAFKQIKDSSSEIELNLNWKENPKAKEFLDVIAEILAEEYFETAKQNKEIFSK